MCRRGGPGVGRCRAEPEGAGSNPADDGAGAPIDRALAFVDGDLLAIDFGDGVGAGEAGAAQLMNQEWWFEVTGDGGDSHTPGSGCLRGICRGRAFILRRDGSSRPGFILEPAPDAAQPDLKAEPWVRDAYPEWHALLHDLAPGGRYPRPAAAVHAAMPNGGACVGVTKVTSYEALKSQASEDPAFWRDGTAPDAPPMTPIQHATLNAGEILATLCGQRGVVMTQLWAGWHGDAEEDVDQSVDAPFVVRALRDAAADEALGDVVIDAVRIEGHPASTGLTAIVAAARAPFPRRAKHLASFGCQAALVAQSPYYQVLVGLLLGYELGHIDAHVREKGGTLSAAVMRQALEDAAEVDAGDESSLPWRAGYGHHVGVDGGRGDRGRGRRGKGGRRKKKKRGGSSVEDIEALFGGKKK